MAGRFQETRQFFSPFTSRVAKAWNRWWWEHYSYSSRRFMTIQGALTITLVGVALFATLLILIVNASYEATITRSASRVCAAHKGVKDVREIDGPKDQIIICWDGSTKTADRIKE